MLRSWRSLRLLITSSLAAKIGTLGAVLLLLALTSVGLTLWVTWQLEGGAAAVNEAGRLRMQTWRLAQTATAADASRLGAYTKQFEQSLALLDAGDPARPLFVPRDERSRAAFDRVKAHWQRTAAAWSQREQASPSVPATHTALEAEALVVDIDAFVAAIEAQLARWTAVLSVFQLGLMALAIAGGIAMLYASHLLIFNPMARLQRGLQQVQAGDLSVRVAAETDDEFGRLAQGFNRMTETLQGFYRNLESKVREKTETLRAERERLRLLYEASAFVAQAGTLQELAQGFARRLREAGSADGVLLRWHDATRAQHVLLASDCVPQSMCEEERSLACGDCHCGAAADAPLAGSRVIRIQSADQGADVATACARHGFDTVLSVPVRLHDQLLGEADLLYRDPSGHAARRIGEADRALLESLAAHLASGMESLRAQALEREAAVSDERSALARELHDSIAQGLAFLKIQLQLLRGGLKRGDSAAVARSVDELDAGIRESSGDVRELLVHFRTRTDGQDIVPALQTTLQKFQHQSGVTAQLAVEGAAGVPLDADVQLQLLHVVQEALSNVRKHARARNVWLTVQQQPQWRIRVRDDGQGFDTGGAPADETHVGLRIMRERAAAVGAVVELRSAPGAGTEVSVTLPRRDTAADSAPALRVASSQPNEAALS